MAALGGVSYSSPVVASPRWMACSFVEGCGLHADLRIGWGSGAPLPGWEGWRGGGRGRSGASGCIPPGMAGERLLSRLRGGEREKGGAVCAPVPGG